MRFSQRGQTMAEYLVVASALMTSFFWAANADCEGYDNCIDKLKTVIHDKYEGYSHSISAVQQYGEFQGEGFESGWGDGTVGSPGSGGGSGGNIPEQDGLARKDIVTSPDGKTNYGTLSGAETIYDDDGNVLSTVQYVVDAEGNIVGTYNPIDGTVTFNDGTVEDALAAAVITDEDGNPVDLQAVVDCQSHEVYGFTYQSGATKQYHNTVTLEEMDVSGYCFPPAYGVVDQDGNPIGGAIVFDKYYASTLTISIDPDSPQTPSGEVVYFDIEVPDEDIYDDSSPGVGERVEDCAVMGSNWDADPDRDALDIYLNSDPSPRLGSLDPDAGIPCPSAQEVTD